MTEPSATEPSAAGIALLAGALDEARRQAEAGATIDLAGLEERVATLCAAAEALPRAEAQALLGPLGDLVAALDPLAAALKTQHAARDAALEGRDDPHTARHRAAAAYGRGPAAAPPPAPLPPAHSALPDDEPT
ncbi:hypothetical protein [Azospirillum doebereinerae]|uniref:Uncharacterized protein n=1 Tax=Azospirillum doebereinerae TaxID=92933 RepID=A0A433J2A9_9PROT|nr:hypothetical protein [Azospirillum doebereinerae]RUQ65234.1 hypothetical protein EJ913_25285 [Azospirillum doebereinerae]